VQVIWKHQLFFLQYPQSCRKITFPKCIKLSSTLFWVCILPWDPEDYFVLWEFQAHLWSQSEWIVDCGWLSGHSANPSSCIYGTLWLVSKGTARDVMSDCGDSGCWLPFLVKDGTQKCIIELDRRAPDHVKSADFYNKVICLPTSLVKGKGVV